mgnify:FL=1|jgi:hypothetical protein
MRKLNLTMLSVFVFGFWLNVGIAGTACTSTSTKDLHMNSDGNAANYDSLGDGYCFQTPTNMDVTIYEVGICTAHASPGDKTACTTLFSDANGQLVNLSVGSSLNLLGDISISQGTYSHAYILMSNKTAIKTVMQFSNLRTDAEGNQGSYCYTNGDSWDDNPEPNAIMSCGTNASAATASEETIGLMDSTGNDSYSVVPYTVTMAGEQVVSNLYMTDADGTTPSVSDETSKRILGSQVLGNQVTVTPSTSYIDVSFAITDGVAVGFKDDQTGPYDAVFEALKFQITAN